MELFRLSWATETSWDFINRLCRNFWIWSSDVLKGRWNLRLVPQCVKDSNFTTSYTFWNENWKLFKCNKRHCVFYPSTLPLFGAEYMLRNCCQKQISLLFVKIWRPLLPFSFCVQFIEWDEKFWENLNGLVLYGDVTCTNVVKLCVLIRSVANPGFPKGDVNPLGGANLMFNRFTSVIRRCVLIRIDVSWWRQVRTIPDPIVAVPLMEKASGNASWVTCDKVER